MYCPEPVNKIFGHRTYFETRSSTLVKLLPHLPSGHLMGYMVEKLFILRLVAVKQRLDSKMLADCFRMDVKAAAMRLLRYHRQGLFYRMKTSFTGKRLYTLSPKGRERMLYLARNRNTRRG